jgi:hypothetical protein
VSSDVVGQDSDPRLDLEDELDRLYGVAFDQFVSARTGLVRALRKERRRAEAATVEDLKKPSRVVWTVNQLVRRNRKDIELLLDVGHRLLAGQKAVLGGAGPASFDEARTDERAILKRLRAEATTILGDHASSSTLDHVIATLAAAAIDADARSDVARGRLREEVAPAGFGAIVGIAPPAKPAAKEQRAAPTHEPPRGPASERQASRPGSPARAEADAARRAAAVHARAVLKAARERHDASARRLRDAEHVAKRARAELDAAEREVRRLGGERDVAARELEAARASTDQG